MPHKSHASTPTFAGLLQETQDALTPYLKNLLGTYKGPDALGRAMEASVLEGGKRLRPFFHRAACRALELENVPCLEVAAALELIHCYSLVHDDMPCMDDAALRRGAPTIHVRFGQSTALLAGNALLTMAFEVVAGLDIPAPTRTALITCLARASGAQGMMAGQYMDLNPNAVPTLEDITLMQRLKTGALIEACFQCALILGEHATDHPLMIYGQDIGLAFQILDDLKDLLASAQEVGKDVGHDENKVTFVSLLGPMNAAQKMRACLKRARSSLLENSHGMPLFLAIEALEADLHALLARAT